MKKKYFILIVGLIIVLAIGSSLAYLRAEIASQNNSNITLSNLQVDLLTDINNVTMNTLVPVSDTVGLLNTPVTFQIKNNGSVVAGYKVSLVDKDIVSTVNNSAVRYRLKRTIGSNEQEILPISNLDSNGLIDTGVININETISYELVMWIDINSNPNNQTFSKNIQVEGMQVASLDTSGANYPELADNMVPVYYDQTDDTSGVWKVADSKNLDTNHKWFDYNNLMWANAVTVKETNGTLQSDRSVYLDGVDDYIDLGYANYDFQDTASYVIRFKVNELPAVTGYLIGNIEGSGLALQIGTNGIQGMIYFNGDSNCTLSTWQGVSANVWHTAVLTYDGSNINLYLDGEPKITTPKVGTIKVSTMNIVLGANPDTGNQISELSEEYVKSAFVYDRSLTEAEITKYFTDEITDYPKDHLLIEKNKFTETDTRQKYIQAEKGTEVSMSDITSMWVWIPRYKYTLFNANNGLANEQMINVSFEHALEKTGTVTCQDNILTTSSSATSETCTDKNGSIVNGKSTYTHPAFTFGSEELTGFWIGKFESSTDDTTCNTTSNATNCDKSGLNILTIPNTKSLRYMTVSNAFANVRRMEIFGNIHGFSQNEDATTYLNENSVLTGEILNDNNNLDTHLIKNMEWGAVAYLSQSKYGKYGNSMYTTNYKEIYINNHSGFMTGYSGYSNSASSSTTATVLYNDLTDQGSGKGYKGAGASTTGTIYGVYDLNGGIAEYVMGNEINSSGLFYQSSSGTWTSPNYPLNKYYDAYSYNSTSYSSSYSEASSSRGKLGDATKEVSKTRSSTGKWNSDYNYFPSSTYSWFLRGGYYSQTTGAGIFANYYTTGSSSQYYGSRPVLIVPRSINW